MFLMSIFWLVKIEGFALWNPARCDQFLTDALQWQNSAALLHLVKGTGSIPRTAWNLWVQWPGSPNTEILAYLSNSLQRLFTSFHTVWNYLLCVAIRAIWFSFSGLQLPCQVTVSCKSLTLWHQLVCNDSASINNSASMFCIDIN